LDARKSFVEIARDCKVSTAAISERFANLEKSGIIVGSTLQLDYKRLGHNAVCHISVKADSQQEEQIIEYIRKIPNIYGVYRTFEVKYNLLVVATLRSLNELDHVKDIIKRNKSVADVKSRIWTDILNMPQNLSIVSSSYKDPTTKKVSVQKNENGLDEIDIRLIEKLSNNSRESFSKVAKEITTSLDTVARRYKKLVENGTIKATIQIDPVKIGYSASVKFSLAFASQNDTATIMKKLTAIKDSVLVIKTSGEYDLTLEVLVKDIDQLLAAQKEVAGIQGITRSETSVTEIVAPWPLSREYISTF
jgi:Lrp/AsnC family transcriptional regulator, regulator for asnA, asnC and gidA